MNQQIQWPYILKKTLEHLELTIFSVFIAMIIAIPLGIFFAERKSRKTSAFCIRLFAIIQTIPSLAFIGLLVVLLAIFRLPTWGIFPGVIVLITYAIPFILHNTFSGMKQVLPKQIEEAKSQKMTRIQIFFRLEIPISLPWLIEGIRMATVATVAMATLISLIGAGGLGDLIIQGLHEMRIDLILAGSVPAAILGISLDWVINFVKKRVAPGRKI